MENDVIPAFENGWSDPVKAPGMDIAADGERQVTARVSDQTVDADRDVMLAQGFKAASSNLPVLFGHNANDPAMVLGKTIWIRKNPQGASATEVIAKMQFNETPNGELVFELLRNGDVNSFSHRFIADDGGPPTEKELRKHPEWASARWVHRRWEMKEVSVAPVPANRNARLLSISRKSLLDCEVGEWFHEKGFNVVVKEPAPTRSQVFVRDTVAEPARVTVLASNVDPVVRDLGYADALIQSSADGAKSCVESLDDVLRKSVKGYIDAHRGGS